MTEKPYTRADVELVERAIHDVTPPAVDGYVDGRDLLNAEACAVLDALVSAGRIARVGDTAPPTAVITIERPDDEVLEVHVNGEVVATANHDEHGWSGMDAVEKTARAVARACGARGFCDCEEYDCAGECCGVGNCSCTPAPGEAHPRGEGPSIITIELPGVS